VTNLQRFESGVEFGHELNLNEIDAMRFASRFDHPFRSEPFGSASRELFSTLFLLGNSFNGDDWYRTDFFVGQSPTVRWREFYFKTFDVSVFVVVCAAWACLAWRFWRDRAQKKPAGMPSDARILATWSLLSAGPLLWFYLRCPFIASRYLLDLAPAFAAAMASALFALRDALSTRHLWSIRAKCVVSLLFVMWWGFEVFTAKTFTMGYRFQPRMPLTYRQLESRLERQRVYGEPLPDSYKVGMALEEFGIPFNGAGWDTNGGQTKASVALFIHDPEFLELEVVPAEGVQLSSKDYATIQAKIGLEHLAIESSEKTPKGRLLIFRGPQNKEYQSGIQVAFLGFVTAHELSENDSRFRLLRVRWRDG
jgi:hypothetical protein